MNLSQRIANPLDDINIMKTLIEISTYDATLYYDKITYCGNNQNWNSDKRIDIVDRKVHDKSRYKFYSFIFNKMKNNIISTKNSLCL